MAVLYGKQYTRREIEARVGSMKQLCDLRSATLAEGKEDGTKIIEMTTGLLSATIVPGRCLDLANLTYKGIPLNFTGKNGIVYAGFADPATNPLRSVNGGMFYTCGLTNVGQAFGDAYFHGRIRLIPAEQVALSAKWEGDEYVMTCGGMMRQNGVCYENLSLTREIKSALGSKTIEVHDVIHNDGFASSPFMMMYHVVFGFPLLDAESVLYAPVDPSEMNDLARHCAAPTPEGKDNGGGAYHVLADQDGRATYCMYNPKLNIGLEITFNAKTMPFLSQWKSMQSGDYAMGLMPANCHGSGRQYEMDQGTLRSIEPDETVHTELILTAIEGEQELEATKAKIALCRYPVK